MVRPRNLLKPIILNDGRHVGTLREAAKLLLDCEQRGEWNAHWNHAVQLMLKAARRDSAADDLEAFDRQLQFVLKAEGLI
jgi:hypothetical protein